MAFQPDAEWLADMGQMVATMRRAGVDMDEPERMFTEYADERGLTFAVPVEAEWLQQLRASANQG